MTKPIAVINDDIKIQSLVLFVNPVEVHNTGVLVDNNILGPYTDIRSMYERTIRLYYGHDLQRNRDSLLCQLLWLASINPDDQLLMQTRT